jgi:hypothetical protein
MQTVPNSLASRKPVTIILTPEQSALYEEGGFSSWRLEEDLIGDLDCQSITETVVVALDTGEILFAISQGVIV